MLESDDDIQHFLYYGYAIPRRVLPPAYLSAALAHESTAATLEPISAGVLILRDALADALERAAGGDHIIPLSGGLDSRVILAWLVQHVDPSRLRAVTFGVPGTYDYDIGRLVAREAGVRAETIDLTAVHWTADDLHAFARNSETAIPLFEAYLFHQVRERFGGDCVYWSGFLGESLAGSHVPRTPSPSWDAARARFARWKAQSVPLARPGFDAVRRLPEQPFYDAAAAPTYDDQLDLAVRQQHYIAPLLLRRGYSYTTPFAHPEWISFSLRQPVQQRRNAALYHRIISTAFPALFSLPTKTNHGLPLHTAGWRARVKREYVRSRASLKRRYPRWFRGALPTTNYLDFDEALRRTSSLSEIVFEALVSLEARGIIDWLDIDALARQHRTRERNIADALLSLASLELYLQARA